MKRYVELSCKPVGLNMYKSSAPHILEIHFGIENKRYYSQNNKLSSISTWQTHAKNASIRILKFSVKGLMSQFLVFSLQFGIHNFTKSSDFDVNEMIVHQPMRCTCSTCL